MKCEMIQRVIDNWFLCEPAFFALYCQQQLEENARMDCPLRCGEGRLEYNPLLLSHKNYAEVEQLMRIEMIRLFLKHPYERQPDGCCREVLSIGSNITIADGYCMLHHEKLPLQDPGYYHLPLGQYYEWYCKELQQKDTPSESSNEEQQDNGKNQNTPNNNQPNDTPLLKEPKDRHLSSLWHDDAMQRQRINELIERTTDWGSLPAELIEKIKASTRAKVDPRLVWQGFHSAVLSNQRHLTRMRPNRRTGFMQMGSTRQFDTRLLAAIDVSGSITEAQLADFYSSVNRLCRYGVASIEVCQFDAALGPIEPMQNAKQDVEIHGRGGTSYQPLFDYLIANPGQYDGVMILTDGQAPPPQISIQGKQGRKPQDKRLPHILWVTTDRYAYEVCKQWMRQTGRVTTLR